MTLIDFLLLAIVAGVCGAIGRAIAGASPGGWIVSIAVGFVGAVLGMWIAREMHLPEYFALQIGGKHFPIIWSIIGATLFSVVVSLLTRRRTYL